MRLMWLAERPHDLKLTVPYAHALRELFELDPQTTTAITTPLRSPSTVTLSGPDGARSVCVEDGDRHEDPAAIVAGFGEGQFGKDAAGILFDRALGAWRQRRSRAAWPISAQKSLAGINAAAGAFDAEMHR